MHVAQLTHLYRTIGLGIQLEMLIYRYQDTRFTILIFASAMACVKAIRYDAKSNITTIPTQAIEGDPILHIDDNPIPRIAKDAFITYSNLRKLVLRNLGLNYIEEGAFNGQDKLEDFISLLNWNVHFPSDLGPPTKSLNHIAWWQALSSHEVLTFPYFAAFEKLISLNIGGSYLRSFHPDLLPYGLLKIWLAYVVLPVFPHLSLNAPLLQAIYMQNCRMHTFPFESAIGLTEVRSLHLHFNSLTILPNISLMEKLSTLTLNNNNLRSIPDLYDTPLTTLTLANNPLTCDNALCWVRMWPWMKAASIPADEPVCDGPTEVAGIKLMDVDPTFMECFRGE